MEEATTFEDLTDAEKRIIVVIRDLKPFEKLDIKRGGPAQDKLVVTRSSTNQETFPLHQK